MSLLEKSEYLSSLANTTLYCKLEFYGPTNSYKDRMTPTIVAEAIEKGFKKVVVVSSGNFGLSLAYAAKKAGLECLVLCLSSILPKYKESISSLGARLESFKDTENAYEALDKYASQGYFTASIPFGYREKINPRGIEGYGAISEEIVKDLGDAPDFIVTPSAYGDGATGILNRFLLMKKQGLIKKIPRFVLCRSHETDDDIVYSISTDRTTPQVEYVLKESDGISYYFTEKEYMEGQETLTKKCGFDVEVSSGGIVSALKKLKKEMLLSETMKVVAILTAGNPKK